MGRGPAGSALSMARAMTIAASKLRISADIFCLIHGIREFPANLSKNFSRGPSRRDE